MSDPAFVYVIYIRTTPEKLWDALTDPEMRPKFWFGRTSESDWKTGSKHVLHAPDGSIDFQGTVLESDPPRKLTYTFETASPTCLSSEPQYERRCGLPTCRTCRGA